MSAQPLSTRSLRRALLLTLGLGASVTTFAAVGAQVAGAQHPAVITCDGSASAAEAAASYAAPVDCEPTTTAGYPGNPGYPSTPPTPGTGSASVEGACTEFNGTLTITLTHTGGDGDTVFVLDGVTYTLSADDAPVTIPFTGVPDGLFTKIVTINGVDTTVAIEVHCDLVLTGAPICRNVNPTTGAFVYSYVVNNSTPFNVAITWVDGSATIPAATSLNIFSSSASVTIQNGGVTAAMISSNDLSCGGETASQTPVSQPTGGQPTVGSAGPIVGQEPVAPPVSGQLPVTGSSDTTTMLAIAFGLLALGGTLIVVRRRPIQS